MSQPFQAWTRITSTILSLSNQIIVLHQRNVQVAIRPACGSCLQKMWIPNIKHAVFVVTVTSLLSTTRSLSEWKITLSNVPCLLNLWWKWMLSSTMAQWVTIKQGTQVWTILFIRTICVVDIWIEDDRRQPYYTFLHHRYFATYLQQTKSRNWFLSR